MGMDRDAHCSQGASGKKSLLLHFLLFIHCQLSWQSWSGWAFHRLITMKQVSKDFILKLFAIISLLLPGMGKEGFAEVALLAHQWARGDGDKGHPLAVVQLESEKDICPLPGAFKWQAVRCDILCNSVTDCDISDCCEQCSFFVFTRCVRKCSTPKK